MHFPKPDADSKVSIIASSFFPLAGGMEKQVKMLAEELAKHGKLCWLATPLIENTDSREKLDGFEVRRLGKIHLLFQRVSNACRKRNQVQTLTWYERRELSKGSVLRTVSRSFRAVLYNLFISLEVLALLLSIRKKADVLICFSMSSFDALFVFWGRLLGFKNVLRASSSGAYLFNGVESPFLLNQLLSANAFVALSDSIREQMETAGVETKRIFTIPNMVDIPALKWRGDGDKRFGAAFVGNFSQQPLKGIDVLVRSWKAVVEKYPGALLGLCGGGDQTAIRQLIHTIGIERNVVFMGFISPIETVLHSSRMFILPSRVEGMSNSLLEAMSLGMPCIATNISGNSDLIKNGVNGILVPPEEDVLLSNAICFLLSETNTATRLGVEARKTIRESHSRSIVVNKYLKLIGEL
jgi:glycosyltransferase involved in cell wall biosynthesis